MLFVSIIGIFQFVTLPKEQFPEIVIPTIYVQTVYVGNSPKDMENLVTRPIEKQIKSITGAKINKFTSTSQQDYSAIIVEFDTDVKVEVGLQKVKDAIDKAKTDLPTDLVGPLFTNVQLLTRAVELALEAEGSFVAMNNRVSQSVPHLHVHIVPRRKKDGLKGFFWPRNKYESATHLGEVQKSIKAAIAVIQKHS